MKDDSARELTPGDLVRVVGGLLLWRESIGQLTHTFDQRGDQTYWRVEFAFGESDWFLLTDLQFAGRPSVQSAPAEKSRTPRGVKSYAQMAASLEQENNALREDIVAVQGHVSMLQAEVIRLKTAQQSETKREHMMIVTPSLEIDVEALIRRAVRNAMAHHTGESTRWAAVADTFGLGSTSAKELCRYFELDPDEMVYGVRCLACEP